MNFSAGERCPEGVSALFRRGLLPGGEGCICRCDRLACLLLESNTFIQVNANTQKNWERDVYDIKSTAMYSPKGKLGLSRIWPVRRARDLALCTRKAAKVGSNSNHPNENIPVLGAGGSAHGESARLPITFCARVWWREGLLFVDGCCQHTDAGADRSSAVWNGPDVRAAARIHDREVLGLRRPWLVEGEERCILDALRHGESLRPENTFAVQLLSKRQAVSS